jgi:hypothetical protein
MKPMGNKILKSGNIYRVANEEAIKSLDKLPPQNYTVKYNEQSGEFFLEVIAPFNIPSKLYGDVQAKAERILNTYESRNEITGVLLEGSKGSGKTLLAKYVSQLALKLDIPTVVINQPFCGDVFNQFIQSLGDGVIVVFDEFEKVYNHEEQERVLTLLDGVFPSKKLFFLTVNNMRRVNSQMVNRPGRIYYMINYSNLSSEFIAEYCDDNLEDTSHTSSIVNHAKVFNSFNFDMLQAVVEEMNRYNESFFDAITILNVDPESAETNVVYDIYFDVDGTGPVLYNGGSSQFNVSDPSLWIDIDDLPITNPTEAMKPLIEDCVGIPIKADNLVDVDMSNEVFTYHTVCKNLPVIVTVNRMDPYKQQQKVGVLEAALGHKAVPIKTKNKKILYDNVEQAVDAPAIRSVSSLREALASHRLR